MPSSYALGAYYEKWVKDQVASGRYNNASEVIRDALRQMEARLALPTVSTLEELREAIQLGRDSGPDIPLADVMADLDAEIRAVEKQKHSDAVDHRKRA